MSSHHFVREGQEPALLIIDALSFARTAPLLEWAPLVIVSEYALDEVLMWGIKIDAVITHAAITDTLEEQLAFQMPIDILRVTDQDIVRAGIELLRSRKSSAINITADILIEKFDYDHKDIDVPCVLINREADWSLIRGGGTFEKWLNIGHQFKLFSSKIGAFEMEGASQPDGEGFVMPCDGRIKLTVRHRIWFGDLS